MAVVVAAAADVCSLKLPPALLPSVAAVLSPRSTLLLDVGIVPQLQPPPPPHNGLWQQIVAVVGDVAVVVVADCSDSATLSPW